MAIIRGLHAKLIKDQFKKKAAEISKLSKPK